MDYDALRDWWLVEGRRAPSTVDYMLRRARFMERHGFRWDLFLESAVAAREEARRWLAQCALTRPGRTVLRNYTKTLNAVAEWAGATRESHFGLQWELPKEAVTEGKTFTSAQVDALRAYRHPDPITERRRRAMIYFCENTGLRLSELARLRLRDLQPTSREVHVAFPAKRGVERDVPMPGETFHPKMPVAAWLRVRGTLEVSGDPLWVWGSPGAWSAMTVNGFCRELWLIGQDVGFSVSTIRFRRWRATMFNEHGVPAQTVQRLYGHRNIASTMRYMTVSNESVKRSLADRGVPGFTAQ